MSVRKSPFTVAIDHLKQTREVLHATEHECINQLILTKFLNSSVYKDHKATQHFICKYDNEKYSLFPMKCADSKKDKTPKKTADLAFFPDTFDRRLHVFSPGDMKKWVHDAFDDLEINKKINLVEITRIKGAGNPYLPFFSDKIIHDCGNLFDGNGKAPKLITKSNGNPKYIVTWGAKIDTSSTSGKELINSDWNRTTITVLDNEHMKILGHLGDFSLVIPTSKVYNDHRNETNWKEFCDKAITFQAYGAPETNMLKKAVGIKSKDDDIISASIKSLGDGYRATEIVSEGAAFASPSAHSKVLTALTCDSVLAWQWNFFIEIFGLEYAQFVYTHNEKGGKKISKLYFRPSIAGLDYFQDIETEVGILQEQYKAVIALLLSLKTKQLIMDDKYYDYSDYENPTQEAYNEFFDSVAGELRGLEAKFLEIKEEAKTINESIDQEKQDKLKEKLIQLKTYTLYPVLYKRKDQEIKTTRNHWRWCEAHPVDVTFFGKTLDKRNNRMGVIFHKNNAKGFFGGARGPHMRRLKMAAKERREMALKERSEMAAEGSKRGRERKMEHRRALKRELERINRETHESCYMIILALPQIYKKLDSLDSLDYLQEKVFGSWDHEEIWEPISSKKTWEIILDYVKKTFEQHVTLENRAAEEKEGMYQVSATGHDNYSEEDKKLIPKLESDYNRCSRLYHDGAGSSAGSGSGSGSGSGLGLDVDEEEGEGEGEGKMDTDNNPKSNNQSINGSGSGSGLDEGEDEEDAMDEEGGSGEGEGEGEGEDDGGSDIDESVKCLKIEIYSIFYHWVTVFAQGDKALLEKIIKFFKDHDMIDTISLQLRGPSPHRPNRGRGIETVRLNCLYDEEPSLVNLLYYKYHIHPDYSFANNKHLIYGVFVDMFMDSPNRNDYNPNGPNIGNLLKFIKHKLNPPTSKIGKGGGSNKKNTKKNNKRKYTKKRRNRNKPKGNTIKTRIITKSQKKRRPKFPV